MIKISETIQGRPFYILLFYRINLNNNNNITSKIIINENFSTKCILISIICNFFVLFLILKKIEFIYFIV